MSVSGPWDGAQIAQAFRDARLNRSLNLSSLALLYYDYLLTLPAEIERYWRADRRFRRPAVWFLLCRYLSLVGNVPVLVQVVWPVEDHHLCSQLIEYHQIYIVVSQALVAILLNIRTYALYERSRRIFYLLWSVSLAVLAVCCYAIARHHEHTPMEPDQIGCNVANSPSLGHNLAIAWGAMLCHDIMIFSLTLWKALSFRSGSRDVVDIIFRDGTMYFGLIMCSTSTTMFLFLFGRPIVKGTTATLTNVLSTTLIARLMLNIRSPKLLDYNRGNRSRLQTSSRVSDDPIVTSAFDTGRPDWTEFGYEVELYQTEEAGHRSRHDVIELVRRDHPPERHHLGQPISSRADTLTTSEA